MESVSVCSVRGAERVGTEGHSAGGGAEGVEGNVGGCEAFHLVHVLVAVAVHVVENEGAGGGDAGVEGWVGCVGGVVGEG